jgi:hypothetical protein
MIFNLVRTLHWDLLVLNDIQLTTIQGLSTLIGVWAGGRFFNLVRTLHWDLLVLDDIQLTTVHGVSIIIAV